MKLVEALNHVIAMAQLTHGRNERVYTNDLGDEKRFLRQAEAIGIVEGLVELLVMDWEG